MGQTYIPKKKALEEFDFTRNASLQFKIFNGYISPYLAKFILFFFGYRFKIAHSAEEIRQANILRQSLNENFENKEEILKLHEIYDARSTIFTAFHRDRLVGTLRVISYEKCPIRDFYNISLPESLDKNQIFELGGLAIDKKFRKSANLPILGLVAMAYRYSLKKKRAVWVSFCKPWLLKLFKQVSNTATTLNEDRGDNSTNQNRLLFPSYFNGMGKQNICVLFNLRATSMKTFFKKLTKMLLKKRLCNGISANRASRSGGGTFIRNARWP